METVLPGGVVVSDDRARLDLDAICRFLMEESYWARDRPRAVIERGIAHAFPMGAYGPGGEQAGFAMAVTDRAAFALLSNVFVLPAWRGRGIGAALVRALLEHPELAGVNRWSLNTDDAHGLYARFGFAPPGPSGSLMERRRRPGPRAGRTAGVGAGADPFPMEGGCTCRGVRYRVETRPLFVNCCHCTRCQRESGSAFALNAMIEARRVTLLCGAPEVVVTPSNSGTGQRVSRCPVCRVAVWSTYASAGERVRFVRVGTLDRGGLVGPDIHIFTSTRQGWVVLPAGAAAVPGYYDRREHWPAESLARWEALRSE